LKNAAEARKGEYVMKINRSDSAKFYNAPGHVGVASKNLHAPDEVEGGAVALNCSSFEPGGKLDRTAPPPEMIYYILEGEMTLITDEGTETLGTGDSVHFHPGEARALENRTDKPVRMLIVARVS